MLKRTLSIPRDDSLVGLSLLRSSIEIVKNSPPIPSSPLQRRVHQFNSPSTTTDTPCSSSSAHSNPAPLQSTSSRRTLLSEQSPSTGDTILGPTVQQLRIKYVDKLIPPVYIGGMVTLTDGYLVFEPDLEDPQVLKLGLSHYTIFVEMDSILHSEILRHTDSHGQWMKDDESILQVLTKEKQTTSSSSILRFLGNESRCVVLKTCDV